MNVFAVVLIALSNLRVNWLRSILTMLGMVFGTGAVIATLSSNEGAQRFIQTELGKLGTNVLTVQSVSQTPLRPADAELLLDYSRHLKAAAVIQPVDGAFLQVDAKILMSPLLGVEPSYFSDLRLRVARGRTFSAVESLAAAPVVVLGAGRAADLFGRLDPVDRVVLLRAGRLTLPLRVIGVLAAKGTQGGVDFDAQSFVNPRLARAVVGDAAPPVLLAILLDENKADQAKADIRAVLRPRQGAQPQIADAHEAIARTQSIWRNQNLVGIILAAVSLLTGGIGIMNIMLLSIHQRRREIGLRKAIGATGGDIAVQFLLEAVILCFLGGLAGVLAGWIFGRQVAAMLGQWEAVTSPSAILVSLGFAAATGVFFGLAPAMRASRLEPYDALRAV